MPGGRKVQANYDDLANIANQFAQEASQTEQMLQQVQNCVNNLQSGGWIGRGAQAFFAEMNDEVAPGVRRLAQALDDASNTIKRISDLISQAEHDASSLFAR